MKNATLAQIAWVTKDIKATEKFFHDVMGVEFDKNESFSVKDYEPTYYGKPTDNVSKVYMGYAGGVFLELIEPISGTSIFQDFLDKNPDGGLQHIAYRVPIAEFDKAVEQFTSKGYQIISTFNTPIAKIFMFDTYKELGVVTELMGITEEGVGIIEKMKK